MNADDFTGFVLIGGKSSRMGADKFALKLGGENFLERAVNTLKPICQTVKIVLNQTQNIETNQPIVRDIYTERGALGGIHAGLKNCETKFAMFLAVDMPFVTVEVIDYLINTALISDQHSAIVPLQSDNRPQPLCAVYRVNYCLPILEKLLEETISASVNNFLQLISPCFIAHNKIKDDNSKDIFFNVNSPQEFQKIQHFTSVKSEKDTS